MQNQKMGSNSPFSEKEAKNRGNQKHENRKIDKRSGKKAHNKKADGFKDEPEKSGGFNLV